jgi:hypothetical protein
VVLEDLVEQISGSLVPWAKNWMETQIAKQQQSFIESEWEHWKQENRLLKEVAGAVSGLLVSWLESGIRSSRALLTFGEYLRTTRAEQRGGHLGDSLEWLLVIDCACEFKVLYLGALVCMLQFGSKWKCYFKKGGSGWSFPIRWSVRRPPVPHNLVWVLSLNFLSQY